MNWNNVTDWSATLRVIAKEAGCSQMTAWKEKNRRGIKPNPQSPEAERWKSVDWGICDNHLAKKMGVSRERVRQKRKALTNTHSWQGRVYLTDSSVLKAAR